jgi:hypothetical protein
MPAELGHAGFKRAACTGGREEEQHGQDFIAQYGVGFPKGAFAFQVKSHIQNGFDFFLAEIEIADQVTAV